MHARKQYITPSQLLSDAFELGWRVFESGFRPDLVVAVWRGGTPVGVALHELLELLGVRADHYPIRTASYTGISRRQETVRVDGLDYLVERAADIDRLLLVDDVYDTGLSLQQIIADLEQASGADMPEVRVATPYFKPGNNLTGRIPDYFLHRADDWLVFPHELIGLSVEEMRGHKPELAALIDRVQGALETAGGHFSQK
jgi:hypoxanthine phosphoribosyltransferase